MNCPAQERFLVTGALGCLGAWVSTLLAREGAEVVAHDLGHDDRRLRLVAGDQERSRVTLHTGDITDQAALADLVREEGVTHIVHLAALQAPFCAADPALGASVNVVGTVNVFEAARAAGLRTAVAHASSAAAHDAGGHCRPSTLYGVYKLACEGAAEVYWADHGLASVGLRPACVYGAGRDRGITAAVTEAITAAGAGRAFRIPFRSALELQYAPDVARAMIAAARSEPAGAVLRVMPPTEPVAMETLVHLLEREAPASAERIGVDATELGLPPSSPGEAIDVALTPLEAGIRETMELTA